MTRDQYTFTNPAELYADFDPKKQHQPEPGLDAELKPKADLGETTYRGTGRLSGPQGAHHGRGLGHRRGDRDRVRARGRRRRDVVPARGGAGRAAHRRHPAGRRRHGAHPARATFAIPRTAATSSPGAVDGLGGLDILVNNGGKQVFNEDLDDPRRRAVRRHLQDERVRDVLDHEGRAAPPAAGLDDHQHDLDPGVPTRPRSWSTTPRRRPRSTRSRRRWLSSSRPRASA